MAAPTTTMIVSNIGQTAFWAGGTEIPAGQEQEYDGVNIQDVFADINFWAACLGGLATIQINGVPIPTSSGPVVAFMLEVAVGNITPTP